MTRPRTVSVIGGGPAGMMAAIAAARAGATVRLWEKNGSFGRKLLATGNGRCNFTNRDLSRRHFHGGSRDLIDTVLSQFDGERTRGFFQELGVDSRADERGRCFPASNEAGSVLFALEQELARLGVEVNDRSEIVALERSSRGYVIGQRGGSHASDAVILACGGAAAPQFGSNGGGFELARQLGHRITPIRPSLVPIEFAGNWFHKLQGIRLDMELAGTRSSGTMTVADEGLFTHYGLSGPLALGNSRGLEPGDMVSLSFVPGMDADKLLPMLHDRARQLMNREAAGFLIGWLPEKLGGVLVRESGVDPASPVASLGREAFRTLARLMSRFPAKVKSLRPLKEAQVTAGGVDCGEIDATTMQSTVTPGLFFCGEVVDVDGDSGGYNLQWCWSSGHVAGSHASASPRPGIKG